MSAVWTIVSGFLSKGEHRMITAKASRIALLFTSALISASAAIAQTAPNGTWTIASISNTATNTGGAIDFNGNILSPTIGTSTGGSISGSAVGASGSDSISFVTSGTATPSESVVVAGTTTLTGNNTGVITADVDVEGASIATGSVSGSISASAVGGVGSLSISSVNSTTNSTTAVSTNNATFTGAVDINGNNSGTVTFTGDIGFTGDAAKGATIDGGKNNSVSVSAVGAAGSLSYSNVVTATNTSGNVSSAETVLFSDAVTVDGDNNVGGDVTANTNIYDGLVSGGTGNSISGAAVGASASVSLSANNGTSSKSDNSVTFSSTVGVTGDNAAGVTLFGDIGSSANLASDDSVITSGNNNSISLAGVGASGSLSYSGIQTGSLSEENYTVTGLATVLGTNSGTVAVTSEIYGGTITAGNGNSISVASVGASGSVSLSSLVDGGTPNTTVTFTGGLDVDGTNSGAVTLTTDIGLSGEVGTKPTITAGNNNSISAAAVGASGSVSYSDVQLATTANTSSEQFSFGNVTVNGTNNVGGIVTATGDVIGGTISGGNANSISVAAVGASGSVSADSLALDGAAPDNTVTFGTIAVVGTNNESVSLTGNLGVVNVAGDMPSIAAGNNNSISLAGVGASASVSFSNTNLSGADGSNNYTIGNTTILGDNNDTVTVTGTAYGGTVSGGTGNSISVAAVGSSASFSSTSIVDGSGTSPSTSLTTGTLGITSNNSAAVLLTGSVGSVDATTDPTISGATTVNASISSAAVGASGSLSVSNLVTGGATPDETVTIGVTTFDVDNTSTVTVASGGIFGGTITGGTGGSISQAAVGASGSSSFTNIVDGAGSTLSPAGTDYSIAAQSVVVDNTGTISITGDIGTANLANNASITGGVNNSISVTGVGASGSTSFTSIYSDGATGAGVYSVAAITSSVTNTGGVTVNSSSYGANIGGGVNSAISAAAVGASASTSFTVITR